MVCRSTDSNYKYNSFHSYVCIAFTDMALILQEIPEASQWPSLMTLFWSLKEPHWSWGVTVLTVQLSISSGTSSTLGKDPSCSSSTFQGTPWFKALEASWLNLRAVIFSFNLRKFSAHWHDSAEYFCALSATVPGTAGGVEHKPLMVVEFSDTHDRFLFYFKWSFAIWLQMRQRELSRQRYFYISLFFHVW